ncbi:MAG: SDR family NAD(P)-dependent oxidoreductase [Hyphomicrobiales bacterium]|nr:SDR family NAD(P)-dependent oxidoreductase [Hyphomicrobiales bacterium]
MARVLVTGSSTGLGLMAARLLADEGHSVIVHGRDSKRADDALKAVPEAVAVVGDLASIAETKALAEAVNRLGPLDAVIHNAAVGYQEPRSETADRLPRVFAVNTLAPYILTALIQRPKRLVYMSSGMHRGASDDLSDLLWRKRPWQGSVAYAESKLHDVLLAFGFACRWPNVLANAVDPGWVATRMGGPNAPDDLDQGHRTQVWLAVSNDPAARVSGRYFFHMRTRPTHPNVDDVDLQERLIEACAAISGVSLP